MKKKMVLAVCFAMIVSLSAAQKEDSVRIHELHSVAVSATRATEKTPIAFSNMGKEEIQKNNTGQDIPFILQMMPSVVATSESGIGVGYTGLRVRGTDASRINVTANGIPMNDAESHAVFWVNIPDLASSLEDIQMQRGVGTSTNGAGAFGASINMKTESLSLKPYGELSASAGSYNTWRRMAKVSSGLIGNRFAFNLRLSDLHSDGYVRRASTDLKSYFAQAAYFHRNTSLRFITFGGSEKTYHAWDGVDSEMLKADRRYNTCGEIRHVAYDEQGYPMRDEYGEPITTVTEYYDNQYDNYRQTNNQLLFTHSFSTKWNMNFNMHYTDGYGYYEEYKNARTLKEYGLTPFSSADPSREPWLDMRGNVDKSSLIRRKIMDNGFGGAVFSVNYSGTRLEASVGGGANRYQGPHYGRVIWVQNYIGNLSSDHEYYRSKATKDDANIFIKVYYQLSQSVNFFADIQYRHIGHKIAGVNDKWDWSAGQMQRLDVDRQYDFLNPKTGLTWQPDNRTTVYASCAVAHKEPSRNNFTEAKRNMIPRAEKLTDLEAGYKFRSHRFSVSAGLYYMKYKDQLILTGETNEIGEPLAENIPDSYRMGVEFVAGVELTEWLRWDINTTISRNRIKNYSEYLDDYNESWEQLNTQSTSYVGNTTIAFSPSVIANSMFTAKFGALSIALHSACVGKQYLTNSMQNECSLNQYFVSNFRLGYVIKTKIMRHWAFYANINNIFDSKYCSNGWGGSYFIVDDKGVKSRSNYSGFFPQAGINLNVNVVLRF